MTLAQATMPPQPTPNAPPGTAAAAWLASLAVHLLLATLGVLVFPTLPRSERAPQVVTAGIVLLHRAARQMPYFPDTPPASIHTLTAGASDGASEVSSHTVLRPAAGAPAASSETSVAAGMLPDERELPALGLSSPTEEPRSGGPDVALSDLPLALPPTGGVAGRPRLGLSPAEIAAILAEDAAQPREERPSGPTAALALFGLPPVVGRSFVLVLDRSQSMGAGGLDVLRAAARELAQQLQSLTPQQKVQVVAYNESVVYATGPHLAPATEEHRAALVAFVANLPAYGQTEHIYGLLAALKLRPEVIFLLTDGGDPIPKGNQLALVQRLAAGRTQIHCLHFGRGPADERASFLLRLARDTGGQYRYFQLR